MDIDGKNGETKIDTAPLSGDKTRHSKAMRKKRRRGDSKALSLTPRMKKKLETSIMVAGGISCNGLNDLMVLKGTMSNFTYLQALEYYKDCFDSFKDENLFFWTRQCHFPYIKAIKKIIR